MLCTAEGNEIKSLFPQGSGCILPPRREEYTIWNIIKTNATQGGGIHTSAGM